MIAMTDSVKTKFAITSDPTGNMASEKRRKP